MKKVARVGRIPKGVFREILKYSFYHHSSSSCLDRGEESKMQKVTKRRTKAVKSKQVDLGGFKFASER